jgi:hypothetical protein
LFWNTEPRHAEEVGKVRKLPLFRFFSAELIIGDQDRVIALPTVALEDREDAMERLNHGFFKCAISLFAG